MRAFIFILFGVLCWSPVLAIEPGVWAGCWAGRSGALTVAIDINPVGELGVIKIGGVKKRADYSYGYASDGVNPMFAFYGEEEGEDLIINYAYFIPGMIDSGDVLVGFYKRSTETVRGSAVMKNRFFYVVLKKVACK